MKRMGRILALLFTSALPSLGQVSVEVALEQEQFLVGEAIPAAVRITNRSGQTLRFGSDAEWLTFLVESRDGFIVVKNEEVPVLGEFTLESSKMATRRVDLAPYFALTHPGRYNVTATVRVKEWDARVASPPKGFDTINGAKLWSQEFGVPVTDGQTNRIPEVRKYTLQQANYLRNQLRLYVRLTDAAESKVLKVFPIGPMVSFGQPEAQLDRVSNLHVLHQVGPRTFSYAAINPDGELLLLQTYDYGNSRPRLQVNEEGKFSVAGGVRRVTRNDVPAPKSPDEAPKQPNS
jgi:hypothetical protein